MFWKRKNQESAISETALAEVISFSDVGKRRKGNEDSICTDETLSLLLLADGIGGYSSGEVASTMAVCWIYEFVLDGLRTWGEQNSLTQIQHQYFSGNASPFHPHTQLLNDALEAANNRIIDFSEMDGSQCKGMGTTIVCAWFHSDILTVAHVGDSRLYAYSNGILRQITEDHSIINRMRREGKFSEEEILKNAPKNLVTRALGLRRSLLVSLSEEKVIPGTVYMLCSDGLSDLVEDGEIQLILEEFADDLPNCGQMLVDRANGYGGKDNISLTLCRAAGEPLSDVELERIEAARTI